MSEAIVLAGEKNLAIVPEFLKAKNNAPRGLEEIKTQDILMPRLCIAQPLSPEIDDDSPKRIAKLAAGDLFNSLTGEIYGKTVKTVPLFQFYTFIEFVPREEGGGVRAFYNKEAEVPAGHLDFINDEKPVVTKFQNMMAILVKKEGGMEPIVISFKSSGLKVARKWAGLIRQSGRDAFAKVYDLVTTKEKNDKGAWFGANIKPLQWVPEEFYLAAEQYFNNLKAAGIQVDTSGMDGEAAEPGSTEDGAAF